MEHEKPSWSGTSLDFARQFFPVLCRRDFCRMHLESFAGHDALPAGPVLERQGSRLAIAAPRGAAKSTIHSLILPLMDICLGRELYILLISATKSQAIGRLRNLSRQIDQNAALEQAFGLKGRREAPWSSTSIVVAGCRVDAYGAGCEIRGISHGEARPTRIVLDDAENSRRVGSTAERQRTMEWFEEVIENLGDGYTHIEVVGTILHRDSLLSCLLQRSDFTARTYRSVEQWATDSALWDEWKRLLLNPVDPARRQTARAFFDARRREMLAGSRVLWEEREDYEQLMVQLHTRSRSAFYKEKQNEPLNDASRMFHTARWRRFALRNGRLVEWIAAGREDCAPPEDFGNLSDLLLFGFLDPAMGGARGDFAAIATVGRDLSGRLFVLDLWMERATPQRQVVRAFDLHDRWRYQRFQVETNGQQRAFLDLMAHEREDRRVRGKPSELPFRGEASAGSKSSRIAALEPMVESGFVLFNHLLPAEFFDQADCYPGGHDDGLDALAGAIALARRKAETVIGIGEERLSRKPETSRF